jgi:hypothetical protein
MKARDAKIEKFSQRIPDGAIGWVRMALKKEG